MINSPLNDKAFVELHIQGSKEFGEAWTMMNRYIVALAKRYRVDHQFFAMGLSKMALDALRTDKINFTVHDFLDMVFEQASEPFPVPGKMRQDQTAIGR